MNINIYAFLLPLIAGLATLIGTVFIFFKFKNRNNIIINTLSFSAGVMISISIFDLIPESYRLLKNYFYNIPNIIILLIFFSIGNLIALFTGKKVKEKGSSSLYNVGIISMISIIIHNIFEGMICFISLASNFKLGLSMTIAILAHNIPDGLI